MSATRGALYRSAREQLRNASIETPDLDARLLTAAVLGCDPAGLLTGADLAVQPCAGEQLAIAIARRIAGEPVDRILGVREFWGLPFHLMPETLAPRPDTETVVQAALAVCPERARILDLGTGSGCLLVALLHEKTDAWGIGADISPGAAIAARANAVRNGVGDRAAFIAGDWGTAVAGPFDLVVSNPPYIETAVIAELDAEVREHDPMRALDGGADGLDAYRRIAASLPALLPPGGFGVVELGAGQEADVARLMAAEGMLRVCGPARPDIAGIPRAMVVQRVISAARA